MSENENIQNENQESVTEEVTETQEQVSKYENLDINKVKYHALSPTEVVKELDSGKPTIIFPAITSKEVIRMYTDYGNLANFDQSDISETQMDSIRVFNQGIRLSPSPRYNGFEDRLNSSVFTNNVQEEGKQINLRTLTADDIKGGNLSQSLILAQMLSQLGSGEKTNVPLWHSGFRVTIKPPTSERIISLHNKIFKDKMLAGKETLGLTLSNDSGILHRYFVEMFVNLIESTTLDIDLGTEDITKYISVLDLNIMYLAVLAATATNGVQMYTNCTNASQLDETGKPLCNFSLSATADPTKLLWVDMKRLSKPMRKQMSVVASARITLDNIKWYQAEVLKVSTGKNYVIKTIKGEEMEVHYKVPTVSEFISEGLGWILSITENVRESLSEGYTDDERDTLVENVQYLMRLGTYNAFVDYISVRGNKLTDREYITQALITYGKTQTQMHEFLEATVRYIEDSSIAIAGYPAYTCPTCKKDNINPRTERLKELIPIEPYILFFDWTAQQLVSQAGR